MRHCFKKNFITLSPAAIPISSLEPVTLVEGQSYRKAALCRSVARPPPRISWDSSLNGQSTNRSSASGAVTSHYSLHPLRAMNGMKLDCLVWHPTSQSPRRIKNNLVVHCEYQWKRQGRHKDKGCGETEIQTNKSSTSCFNHFEWKRKEQFKYQTHSGFFFYFSYLLNKVLNTQLIVSCFLRPSLFPPLTRLIHFFSPCASPPQSLHMQRWQATAETGSRVWEMPPWGAWLEGTLHQRSLGSGTEGPACLTVWCWGD